MARDMVATVAIVVKEDSPMKRGLKLKAALAPGDDPQG